MKVKLNYKDDFEYVATNETDNKDNDRYATSR